MMKGLWRESSGALDTPSNCPENSMDTREERVGKSRERDAGGKGGQDREGFWENIGRLEDNGWSVGAVERPEGEMAGRRSARGEEGDIGRRVEGEGTSGERTRGSSDADSDSRGTPTFAVETPLALTRYLEDPEYCGKLWYPGLPRTLPARRIQKYSSRNDRYGELPIVTVHEGIQGAAPHNVSVRSRSKREKRREKRKKEWRGLGPDGRSRKKIRKEPRRSNV
ncbi:hypothetical protein KM043_012274 [Ampulex compressa]|nr:hypothetical protein KM043_012274 [Ampulex compressa]